MAWHAGSVAFDFAVDSLEDVVELVLGADAHGPVGGASAGVAEGEMESVVDAGPRVALGFGRGLARAMALARIARKGEVLVDPALSAVRSQELLTRGSRLGMLGRERVRGLRLDLRSPLRPRHLPHPASLLRPEWVGPPLVAELAPRTLTYVAAPKGGGGSRALEEIAGRHAQRPQLWIRPSVGEPLGALRHAFTRAREAIVDASEILPPELTATLDSLLDGEGLDLDSSEALLGGWLGGEGIAVVDDAERVDSDTLEALSAACERGGIALLSRVSVDGERAACFASLQSSTVRIPPLAPHHAARLAAACLGGALGEREAARWGKRGGGSPAGVVHAVADALESGLLIQDGETWIPRVSAGGRGRTERPSHWILRRLTLLDRAERDVLAAIAVLGGEVPMDAVTELSMRATGGAPPPHAVGGLARAGWLSVHAGLVVLSMDSVRQVLAEAMPEPTRARENRVAAAVIGERARPLCAVAAGVHSLLGGDVDRALPMLRRGAASARAAGLAVTADALDRFTETGEPALIAGRGLFGGAITERAGLQRSDVPPPGDPALSRVVITGAPERPMFGTEEPVTASRFVQAIRDGDHAAVSELASEVRAEGGEPHIAARLDGMASLARGEITEALEQLRDAKQLAQGLSPAYRSRAALALSVALAAAGRPQDALLEALESLARAREADDRQGEHACARFLARLCETVAAAEAAERWELVATATAPG